MFLVVSQTGVLQIDEVMNYELSTYPILRQPDKPQLAEAIRNYNSPKSYNAVAQAVPGSDHYVLDRGLHRLKWMEGCTYSSITDYASFTVKHYAKATVVLMVMGLGQAHQRRSRNKNANKVNITGATKFVGKKEISYQIRQTSRQVSSSSWNACDRGAAG